MPLVIVAVVVAALWLLTKGKGAAAPRPTAPNAPVRGVPVSTGVSSDALDNLAQAIFQNEGGKPGNANVRYNNPGNLRSGPNQVGVGQVQDGTEAVFADSGDGWDALNGYITSKAAANPGWDFYDFAHYYLTGDTLGAGGPKQNPDAYAESLANFLGVEPTQTVSSYLSGDQA